MVVSSACLQNLSSKFPYTAIPEFIHCFMLHFQCSVDMPDKSEAFLEVFLWTVVFKGEYCEELEYCTDAFALDFLGYIQILTL